MASGFNQINKILTRYEVDEDKQRRISREWQDYAYRLAVELDDTKHTSLYMRLGKNYPREMLEKARLFVRGSYQPKNKGRLFMWKLKQLKDEEKKVNVPF